MRAVIGPEYLLKNSSVLGSTTLTILARAAPPIISAAVRMASWTVAVLKKREGIAAVRTSSGNMEKMVK
jgi:hypothetical protein